MMIPITKAMLVLVAVGLGVIITTNFHKGKKSGIQTCVDSNPLREAAQKALDAIGSDRKLIASSKKAKRGQHVFNNGLLKFHRSVLKDLLTEVGGDEQLENLEQDLTIPLNETVRSAISTMVAHFRLDYCNALLADLPLQMIQNAAERVVFNEPKIAHYTSAHKIVLADCDCIKLKILMLAYRIITRSAPHYLNSLLQTCVSCLRSASEQCLVVPSDRATNALTQTFTWTVPCQCNDLSNSTRMAESLGIFKNTTKDTSVFSDESYTDYNADLFGEYVKNLRKELVAYLKANTSVNEHEIYENQEFHQQVQSIATQMVNHEVYVDPMARDLWLRENRRIVQQYNQVRGALNIMFQNILQDFHKVSDKVREFRKGQKGNGNSELK